uniref:Zinc finger protein n=1 Tax=Rhabditophanes sp. KR3021 TaxID=114890 RepID=A0AC35TSB0_9BILA
MVSADSNWVQRISLDLQTNRSKEQRIDETIEDVVLRIARETELIKSHQKSMDQFNQIIEESKREIDRSKNVFIKEIDDVSDEEPIDHHIKNLNDANNTPLLHEVMDFIESSTASQTFARCRQCGNTIQGRQNIEKHYKFHLKDRPFQCGVCGQTFTQITPCRVHIYKHYNITDYKCPVAECGKEFVLKCILKKHLFNVHYKHMIGAAKETTAKIGDIQSGSSSVLLENKLPDFQFEDESQHHLTSFLPPLDDNLYYKIVGGDSGVPEDEMLYPDGGLEQSNQKLGKSQPLVAKCKVCGLVVVHPSKIRQHALTHTKEKPFECSICNERFTRNGSLKLHTLRKHTHEKTYNCTWECGKSFVSPALLNEHVRFNHGGMRRYQCNMENCFQLFVRRSQLVVHLKKVHKMEFVEDEFSSNNDVASELINNIE